MFLQLNALTDTCFTAECFDGYTPWLYHLAVSFNRSVKRSDVLAAFSIVRWAHLHLL